MKLPVLHNNVITKKSGIFVQFKLYKRKVIWDTLYLVMIRMALQFKSNADLFMQEVKCCSESFKICSAEVKKQLFILFILLLLCFVV